VSSLAQVGCPKPFGQTKGQINRFHISGGIGVTKLDGTLKDNKKIGQALLGRIEYQILRGLYVGLEGQLGILKAESTDSLRFVKNNYIAAGVVATLHPFELLLSDNISNEFLQKGLNSLYLGVGALAVRNSYVVDESRFLDVANYNEANGTWILPSLNAGLALPLYTPSIKKQNYFSIILNAQLNKGSNENLDGFHAREEYVNTNGTVSSRFVDGHKDNYHLYTVGLRYSF